jgi:cation-transporting ATPase 13A2
MKPDQKSEAVSYIQDLYSKERILVGFCGDGANDCGALKTAHIGVSLSLSEASVAAPFTSNITNISSVIIVGAEGRSALTTSFQSFKYLCYYSILQCFGLILLYFVGIDYSFIMYIVNDLIIVFPLSLFMYYHGP